MKEKLYNVICLGPAHNNLDSVDQLIERLRHHLALPIESARKMITCAPVTIKREVTFEEAANYRVDLESLGAHVRLEPVGISSKDNSAFRAAARAKAPERNPRCRCE